MKERLIIGQVLKPQGIRGELKIKTFTDFPEDVKAFKTVYIDDTPYKILSFRVGNDGAAYVGLRGIPDRNAAELFRGKLLHGERDDAPALEEDAWTESPAALNRKEYGSSIIRPSYSGMR